MGLSISRLIDSTPFIDSVRKYSSDDIVPANIDGEFYVAPSVKSSVPMLTEGLFTRKFLPKGSAIDISPWIDLVQDNIIDLQPLIDASTSRDVFEAWHMVYNGYHNFDRIFKNVNIIPVYSNKESTIFTPPDYYEVIQDIPEEGEIIIYYGILIWFLTAPILLATRSTLAGYIKFLEAALPQCHPEFHPYIEVGINWLKPHLTAKLSIPFSDSKYLEAYDKYYSQIYHTENITDILLETIPVGF